jgi:hypothetical protein
MIRIMNRLAASFLALSGLGTVSLLLSGCRQTPSATPAIEFIVVPEAAVGGPDRRAPITGRVRGARPGQRIVLFSKSGAGVWWVQPLRSQPFTNIEADATWKSTVHLGTEYAALLVGPEYRPPATVDALPQQDPAVFAIAAAKGLGTFTPAIRQTLAFSGYDWEIRETPSERGGLNEYDGRNAWTDPEKCLHLVLTQRQGHWTSAEVQLTRALGYGTYVFVVRETSRLDPAAALGLLTWDDLGAEQNHRELDIEISRWGDPANQNAQYVVQPQYVAVNVFRFAAPSGRLTHSIRWEPGRASFKTTRGDGSTGGTPIVAERDFASGVPVPGSETVRMNLLYFRGSPSPPHNDVEVVVEKFVYLP